MTKYEMIYELLQNKVDSGELTIEEAELVNDVAYSKYIAVEEKVKDKLSFVVKPGQGAGKINFGMDRSTVTRLFGEEVKNDAGNGKQIAIDTYGPLRIHYGKSKTVEAIEISSDADVTLFGIKIFKVKYPVLKQALFKKDPECVETGGSISSKKLGISISHSHSLYVTSILAGSPSYFKDYKI